MENHKIGNTYSMINRNGSKSEGWKIAYLGLTGTYKDGKWIDFEEERALIERPLEEGIDFREMPYRFLKRIESPK